MKTLAPIKILILASILLAFSCSKDEFESVEGLCPLVLTTSPIDGAINVSQGEVISVTFNKTMNQSTITANSFTVSDVTPLSGSMTFEETESGTTVFFTPASSLNPNTTYTGKVFTSVKDSDGNALQVDYVWSFSTGSQLAPVVISTDPLNAAINVDLNKVIVATFNQVMDPVTLTSSFTISDGTSNIAGEFTFDGASVFFTPLDGLSSNTTYTATITTGAANAEGVTLANNYVWTFSTGSLLLPTVVSTDPMDEATNVNLDKVITATFSEVMDIETITLDSFKVLDGTTAIEGTFTFENETVLFTPSEPLTVNTLYTATIASSVSNLDGVSLAADYMWVFTTGSTVTVPDIGTISQFGGFGGNAGLTNQGLNTVINNGGIGTTAAATLVTGFHDGITGDIYTETPLNEGLVTGGIFTAPPAPGTATSFAIAEQALLDATDLYNAISPAAMPGGTDPGAGELGGLTLAPGVYQSASGTFNISNGDLTLDAQGDPNALWVFQSASGLTVGIAGPTGAKSVILINGANSANVFWQVGSAATINAAGGGVMVGTIVSMAGVAISTADNMEQTVLNGRAISLVASVTMVNTTINVPN